MSVLLIGTVNLQIPLARAALPGGPIAVGGPTFGISGAPIIWNPAAMPIGYRVDPGPMAVNPFTRTVVVDNPTGLSRVASMFNTWTSVPTAAVSANYAGPLLPSGAYTGGPVAAGGLASFNALVQSCDNAEQSPVMFDPQGNLFSQLGLSSGVIGFSGPCHVDTASGFLQSALLALNGNFQNGVFAISADEFNQAITHEIGHLLGLDHSQINVDVLTQQPRNCDPAEVAGLPIMFPFLFCQARVTSGFPPLAPDDAAWISRLYPADATYGTITGTIYFSDGITEVQGVNVIARSTSDPLGTAFSATSGYLFTGNPGQSVTCALGGAECNTGGSVHGSRDTRLIGTFDIPVLPGDYNIEIESIDSKFVGGSGVGSMRVPIPMPGTAPSIAPVSVPAGGSVNVKITLVGTPPRFDSFETAE